MKTFNNQNQNPIKDFSKGKSLLIALTVIFILALIPAYVVGGYAHPSVDDYYYGVSTHEVWENTHCLSAVFKASYEEMLITYNEWQGNYAAIFLMRLQPGIFGEKYYFVTPLILISTFCICTVYFIYTVLRKTFGTSNVTALIAALPLTLMIFELTDVPSDSFYWFNGSIYYTFFFSLMLLMWALIINICTTSFESDTLIQVSSGKKTRSVSQAYLKVAVLTLISAVLAFFIAGSNFPTALIMVLILVLCFMYYILKKGNKTYAICIAFIAAAALVSFYISISAPGNAIRQASVGGSTSLVKTFIYTFAFGAYSVAHVLSAPALVTYICMLPLFFHVAVYGRKKGFSYPAPLVILVFTWGVYCSMGTPVFYAQGLRIAYRITNIIYFAAHLLIAFNLIYFCGYLERRYGSLDFLVKIKELFARLTISSKKLMITFFIMLFSVSVACVGHISVTESEAGSGTASFDGLPLSIAAAYSIVSGQASTYNNELTLRDAKLKARIEEYDSLGTPWEARHATVQALSVKPSPIYHTDITEDVVNWRNAHLAMYYGLNTVRIE